MGQFRAYMNKNEEKNFLTLTESSLSRLYKHMQEHDAGTITAYRSEYTHKENQQRNRSLLAKLADKRYQITSVKGSYIENMGMGPDKEVEVGEHVYFVVDAEDTGKLEETLRKLGEEFGQDSIMFIPKGGAEGVLWGTSKKDGLFLKYGESLKLSNAVWGKRGEFMTKIRGRPFYFKEGIEAEALVLPEGYFGRYGCHAVATSPWQKLMV